LQPNLGCAVLSTFELDFVRLSHGRGIASAG
jgi:hypothetical protein